MASAARALALACALSLAAGTANAADEWVFCRKSEAAPTAPAYVEVPGDPIFGFTDPSDVGSPGDCGFAMENTGRVGKQRGSYVGIGSKYEFYVTPIENVSLSLSGFSAWEHIRNVPGLDDRTGFAFDGISTEVQYRVLSRGPGNPLAITLAAEPRWARTDPTSGGRLPSWGVELKLLADLPLDEHWFMAGNLNYAPVWVKPNDGSSWGHFSATNTSLAIAWGPDGKESRFFLGLESRLLGGFEGLALGRRVTWAWFAGPNALIYIGDNAAINFAWTPQIIGHERGSSSRRDLDNFERQQFRLKLSVWY